MVTVRAIVLCKILGASLEDILQAGIRIGYDLGYYAAVGEVTATDTSKRGVN